jgi:hypothetical protein
LEAFEDKRLNEKELNETKKFLESIKELISVIKVKDNKKKTNKRKIGEGLLDTNVDEIDDNGSIKIERTTEINRFPGFNFLSYSNNSLEKYAGKFSIF